MPHMTRKEKKKISLRQAIFKGKKCRGKDPQEALLHVLCRCKGAMTLEAALVFPLFLFAVITILSLFLMMQTQYIVGNSLDIAVANTALLRDRTPGEIKTLTQAAFYKELAAQKCPTSLIKGGKAGFSWKNMVVNEIYIDAFVTYRIRFPVNFFGKREMEVSETCRIHRWVGYQGEEATGKEESWVFVTPTQSVYHESRNCTHLKLSIQPIKAASLKNLQKSYAPCAHCTKGQNMGKLIYITAEGGCYHYRLECSGLKRTVYMIKRSQTGGKKRCSRCGGTGIGKGRIYAEGVSLGIVRIM